MNIGGPFQHEHTKQHLSLGTISLCGPFTLTHQRTLTQEEYNVLTDPNHDEYVSTIRKLRICLGCLSRINDKR